MLTVAAAVSSCAGGDNCPDDGPSPPSSPQSPASLLHHGPPARSLSQPTFSSFSFWPRELEGHPAPGLKDFPAVLSPQCGPECPPQPPMLAPQPQSLSLTLTCLPKLLFPADLPLSHPDPCHLTLYVKVKVVKLSSGRTLWSSALLVAWGSYSGFGGLLPT